MQSRRLGEFLNSIKEAVHFFFQIGEAFWHDDGGIIFQVE
jgi:hypothetical protein